LLTSGYVPEGTYNPDHVNALLSQAKTLGDKLKVQFETPSGLPTANINFTTNTPINGQLTNPLNGVTYNASNTAVSGTLILEFYRLADLTGDESFRELVSQSISFCEVNKSYQLLGRYVRRKPDLPKSKPSVAWIDRL
jgi:mannosyl-oligosaccharide alpha-1,2-mannosidase